MKKIIFNKLILDVTKFFFVIIIEPFINNFSCTSLIFLDYVSEDGHGIYTYFGITILNFPRFFQELCLFAYL